MTVTHRRPRPLGHRPAAALAAAVALLLLLPGLAAGQPAEPLPGLRTLPDAMPGDRLLVFRQTPTAFELSTIAPDGSGRTDLTSGASDFPGVWSPDGRHVAFLRIEAPEDGLYVVPSAGGEPRRLDDGGRSPAWSPDGTRIVHSPSTEAQPVPLRIVALDGTATPIPGTDGGIDPVWSPDGTQIAYVDPLRNFALVMVRVDGAARDLDGRPSKTVTPGPARWPVWSPSGDALAFVSQRDGRTQLLVVDGAGSEVFFLTDRFARLQQLAFSPTGTHVAFAATEVEGDDLDLWTARVTDGALTRVTSSDDDDLNPTWHPSGVELAFTRTPALDLGDAPTDVFRVSVPTGTVTRVTATGNDHAVAWAPGRTLRLADRDRVGTSVALSRLTPTAEAVVIARADDHPDALAGGPLAAALDAPILLTGRGGLHPSIPAELDRLGTRTAYLLGGPAALSAQVAEDLAAAGITDVRRLSGPDRFATAVAIADALADLVGPPARVLVVEGLNPDPGRGWPDAVSASGLASLRGEPILLATRDTLPGVTARALEAHAESRAGGRALIVGGTGAVSAAVADQVAARVASVERLSGPDRYGTSVAVADRAVAEGGRGARPWLASGRDWPDALTAAPAAARDGGVLLLVDGRAVAGSPTALTWLGERAVDRAVVVGGSGAITPPVRSAVEGAMRR